jgi:oligoxyloglucan reducing-end-specific cellobiohydrolase
MKGMGFRRFSLPVLCAASLLLLLRLPAQLDDSYVWRPVRIVAGGYVPGFVAHPTEPGLIYARTDIGSVYRWNAHIGQWIPLTDFQAPANYNLNGPESVALDPTDPNRLYIAAGMYTGGPTAVLVSTDQGATFTTVNVPFRMASNSDGRSAGERLAVNPFGPSELLMGTRYNGLWKSEDYAQTWTQASSFPVSASSDGFGVQWVVFDPLNSGTIYAGVYTTSTVYKSADDGVTWTALAGQPLSWPFSVSSGTHAPVPMRAVVNPDGNLYVAYGSYPGPNSMSYGLVEKFNPANNSWTNITPPLDTAEGENSQSGGFCGLTQDPNRSGTLAVSTLDRWYPVDTVYVTHDGGATWIDLAHLTSAAGFAGLNAGNYYFNPSVFSLLSPWLTFGGTSPPKGSAKFGWWMSAVLIDPTNPNHLMFGTGATIYATNNLSVADSGAAPTWFVQALGVEETAVTALISPAAGAPLLSGVGDIGGFRHDDFRVSPAAGMYTNPVATTVGSLDWAGQNPSVIVRTQSPSSASTNPCTYGAYSSDGGDSWAPIPACPTGVNSGNGGALAVDAGGAMLMWTPAIGSSSPQYSMDGGNTWTAVTGLAGNPPVVADKVAPNRFYAFTGIRFYSTGTSGGVAFSQVNSAALTTSGSCNGSGCGIPVVNFSQAGDIWLPLGSNGMRHSADGGVTWTNPSNVVWANSVAVGAAGSGTHIPAIYLYGVAAPASVMGIYRSDDGGTTWVRINDDLHQYGGPTLIQADSRVYGRVYLGMNGRGIVYGEPPQRFEPGRKKVR